ncbi:MAG: glyoxalase family protein [Solirubrobacteraceae bacterium]|nr:glyoxalase family protein [Solirubrobacteraceae bacterium]
MELHALHHVTMITADATENVAFYAELLGLRLVKQTVNFDMPEAYHLYFADEQGSPGAILTWFEFPGVPRGEAGVGMIHRLELGVAGEPALAFWKDRLDAAGYPATEVDGGLRFADYDGLELELQGDTHKNPPLVARAPDVPEAFAIQGVQGARAFAADPGSARELLVDVLGFDHKRDDEYVLGAGDRHVHWGYDVSDKRGREGAGTVHHIAWHSPDDQHAAWQQRARAGGQHVTPIIDRDYFKSIYFRTRQGILFEIATTSPGFAVDEDPEHLGEALRLPTQHEHLREHLERRLTPLTNPRAR